MYGPGVFRNRMLYWRFSKSSKASDPMQLVSEKQKYKVPYIKFQLLSYILLEVPFIASLSFWEFAWGCDFINSVPCKSLCIMCHSTTSLSRDLLEPAKLLNVAADCCSRNSFTQQGTFHSFCTYAWYMYRSVTVKSMFFSVRLMSENIMTQFYSQCAVILLDLTICLRMILGGRWVVVESFLIHKKS